MDIEAFTPVVKSICVAANGAFFGGALYVLSIEFPAMDRHSYSCALKILRQNQPFLGRLEVGLTMVSGISGLSVYFMNKEKNFPFLVAGSLMLSTIPLDKFAIKPARQPLVKEDAEDVLKEEEAREKLKKLRRLLSVRFVASMAAFGYMVYHLTS